MTSSDFKNQILQGIPDTLPEKKAYDATGNHAPKRKDILSRRKKTCCTQRTPVFSPKTSRCTSSGVSGRIKTYGRIYMYRFRPEYKMYARPIR
jgi:urocanate hydratase